MYKVGHYFGYTPPKIKIHIIVRILSLPVRYPLPRIFTVFLSFVMSGSPSPLIKYHAHHAHHADLPGISFASLCPAPFKKRKMASSFAIQTAS